MAGLTLLPLPRHIDSHSTDFKLKNHQLIWLDTDQPQQLLYTAQRFQQTLFTKTGLSWEIVCGKLVTHEKLPGSSMSLTIRVKPGEPSHDGITVYPQGYRLVISPDGIEAIGNDLAGAFYAICTLIQILEVSGGVLPGLEIRDWPDFPARGVMLDISRDKVPTMQTLYQLVDLLAGWKINQLQLYTEHTFAYRNHPEIWSKASPVTGEEILELDRYCRERFIELVPNQNSFGHMHRWLEHPRYAPLGEVQGEFTSPWGEKLQPFSLCPIDPGSLGLLRSLYDELLPHFSSRMFNVGCDETFDLGQGRSQQACVERGAGQVYLDFLLKIYQEVQSRGRTMQFWGDIILNHPELITALPKDMIALEWGYEADHPFKERTVRFAQAGIPFYVCPGTSSWNTIAGRTTNALGNLLNAAENGLKNGAIGYLNTDWGDNGHWQPLPVSYLGFAAGAAYSWAFEANRSLDIRPALSWHAFQDPTGGFGETAYALGEVYREVGIEPSNASALFGILQSPLERLRGYSEVTPERLQRTLTTVDEAMQSLVSARPHGSDANLVRREFELVAWMLRHACQRGMLALQDQQPSALGRTSQQRQNLAEDLLALMGEYQLVWLARNRPGGLIDSLARFEITRRDYRGD